MMMTKYHVTRWAKAFLCLTALFLFTGVSSAQEMPKKPNPAKFVNDYAKILTDDQVKSLEKKLFDFNDTTSTQIVVVTVTGLQGTSSADFAQKLGQAWGIGTKKENNGVVLLVKPKTDEEMGDCSIQVGYGMEEYLTDFVCHHIINNVLIPAFKEDNYYKGINQACDDMISLLTGKFTADEYADGWDTNATIGLIIFILIAGIFIIYGILGGCAAVAGGGGSRGSRDYYRGGGSSGRSASFGGGSFGGGGASGKW